MIPSLIFRLMDNHPLKIEDDFMFEVVPYDVLLVELNMVLTSRIRLPDIEKLQGVNSSILNYGINESLNEISELNSRHMIIEDSIFKAISRFEPRLVNVLINTSVLSPELIKYTVHAFYLDKPVTFILEWNNCTRSLYFNE
ncbi:GPW/gp25 family protein [Providencia rettgeri]|uniref:GPW/gp25 family protein n=1 Tax=Providencia rettgeri TaxID=587 RepID=UPI00141A2025|nr:GPW/gp25 family protein [Providencia rettgeri]NIH07164.1 hypothetical protein [Providencia rettgeri]